MYHLTILYAPDTKDTRSAANSIADAFKRENLDVKVRPAREGGIPDVLASDIVIFGLDGKDLKPANTAFAEMFRAFKGINLAGKLSGLISFNKNNSPEIFRKALKDSDIEILDDVLSLATRSIDGKKIKSWADKLYKKFKDNEDEPLL